LLDYIEHFDELFAQVDVTKEMGEFFFWGGLHTSLENSVRIHNPMNTRCNEISTLTR